MSEPTGRTPSDEALAKIAWQAWSGLDGIEADVIWRDSPSTQERWTIIARAVRAALTEPVAPLAPGETVNLPDDADHYARMLLAVDESGRLVVGITNYLDSDLDVPFAECYASLDAAGVDQIMAVCRRFQAALEGDA